MPASTTFLLTVRKVCAMGLAGSKERGWTFDADAPADLRHVTAFVTGANSGTGLEAAKALASRGARVILGCRSRERGEAAVAQVREHVAAAGASGGSAVLELVDLADLSSVRAAARRVEKAHGKSLNLLVNNAGVMAVPYERTGDGHERQWQTNVLGHHLLTGLLLETLVKNRPSRVVAHASSAARGATSLVAAGAGAVDRPYRSSAGSWARYNLTKVANIWQARSLSEKLKARGLEGEVLSLACQPGYANTNLQFTAGKPYYLLKVLNNTVAQGAKPGADPLLRCCVDPEIEPNSFVGPQYMMWGPAVLEEPSALARDDAEAEHCWRLLAEQSEAAKHLPRGMDWYC